MMTESIGHLCQTAEDLPDIAGKLLVAYPGSRVFAFRGVMGAGKTTFIQAVCEKLGVSRHTTSPTFALVNEYTAGNGEPVYHFDFYRINRLTEALDIGYEQYFYSGYYCLIEWPEKITELLPPDCVYIRIEETGPGGARMFFF